MDFINLSNGIQAIKDYSLKDYRIIRLQSTACEQKRWDYILENISDELLIRLALGEKCIIYDYSNKGNTPRSIWQGLEWIKFALYFNWFNKVYQPIGRVSTSRRYFLEQYSLLQKRTKLKLKYYKKYLNTKTLNINTVTSATTKDGNHTFYFNSLIEELKKRKGRENEIK